MRDRLPELVRISNRGPSAGLRAEGREEIPMIELSICICFKIVEVCVG